MSLSYFLLSLRVFAEHEPNMATAAILSSVYRAARHCCQEGQGCGDKHLCQLYGEAGRGRGWIQQLTMTSMIMMMWRARSLGQRKSVTTRSSRRWLCVFTWIWCACGLYHIISGYTAACVRTLLSFFYICPRIKYAQVENVLCVTICSL